MRESVTCGRGRPERGDVPGRVGGRNAKNRECLKTLTRCSASVRKPSAG